MCNVQTIPLPIRQQGLRDYNEIVQLGVHLTDMKKANVCWNSLRQQIVFIDFGNAFLINEQRGCKCTDIWSDDGENIESILQVKSE
jgi:hypothetical protein